MDADQFTEKSYGGDVLAGRGQVIDAVDGVDVRNVFDESPDVADVEPKPGPDDFTKDFPDTAAGVEREVQPDEVG